MPCVELEEFQQTINKDLRTARARRLPEGTEASILSLAVAIVAAHDSAAGIWVTERLGRLGRAAAFAVTDRWLFAVFSHEHHAIVVKDGNQCGPVVLRILPGPHPMPCWPASGLWGAGTP